jgi:hypothetical protein
MFREGNSCTPDASVNFPADGSLPRITRSTSPGSPLPSESNENHFEALLPAPICNPCILPPPGGFRSKVASPAAFEASESRRKSPFKYFCKHCRRGFTRKSNLDRESWPPSRF